MSDLTYDGSVLAFWVTSLTAPSGPSAAQIAAGVPLHLQMTPTGLTYGAGEDEIDNSKINDTFTTKAVGRRNYNFVATIIRDSADVNGIEAALTYKAAGFLCIRRNLSSATAPGAAQKWDVVPSQVGNPNPNDPGPNTLQTVTYNFKNTSAPFINATSIA